MRHLALIPARGGSVRLPRKNVVEFLGRPIIAHTIESARETQLFDSVVVSTEDEEIAAVAEAWGARRDQRPSALATNEASVLEVALELLERLSIKGESYDVLTVLYATAPLRHAGDIADTMSLIEPGVCDFAMAVSAFTQPVHQAMQFRDGDSLIPVFGDLIDRRKSAVGEYYAGNGSTYCAVVSALQDQRSFYGQGLRGHIMPPERSVDIDLPADLRLAEHYANLVRKAGP